MKITTQKDLRRAFWDAHPKLSRRKRPNGFGSGTHYPIDTRVAFCDWIDAMARSGVISQALASRATL
jgi:hypothetical protein